MVTSIKAIIMTYSYRSQGHTYSFSVIWNAAKGRQLTMAMDDTSSGNAKAYLCKFFGNDYEPTLALENDGMTAKAWKEQKRIHKAIYHNEQAVQECLKILFS
jgi:hypothetical protein